MKYTKNDFYYSIYYNVIKEMDSFLQKASIKIWKNRKEIFDYEGMKLDIFYNGTLLNNFEKITEEIIDDYLLKDFSKIEEDIATIKNSFGYSINSVLMTKEEENKFDLFKCFDMIGLSKYNKDLFLLIIDEIKNSDKINKKIYLKEIMTEDDFYSLMLGNEKASAYNIFRTESKFSYLPHSLSQDFKNFGDRKKINFQNNKRAGNYNLNDSFYAGSFYNLHDNLSIISTGKSGRKFRGGITFEGLEFATTTKYRNIPLFEELYEDSKRIMDALNYLIETLRKNSQKEFYNIIKNELPNFEIVKDEIFSIKLPTYVDIDEMIKQQKFSKELERTVNVYNEYYNNGFDIDRIYAILEKHKEKKIIIRNKNLL